MRTLSIYIHLPWCIRRCPYCDFNAYAKRGDLPEQAYFEALKQEFLACQSIWSKRSLVTLYFGGGTPSLCSSDMIASIIELITESMHVSSDVEITLEANPGTVDQANFSGYVQAGVNRLSLGVQSFDPTSLKHLGRIHNADDAYRAIDIARSSGFKNLNIDIMYALPKQNLEGVCVDLQSAIDCQPEHLSWYQLTLEPQTYFYKHPPSQIPNHDQSAAMMDAGLAILSQAGYERYEVSAYAKKRHMANTIYGIGCLMITLVLAQVRTVNGKMIRAQYIVG